MAFSKTLSDFWSQLQGNTAQRAIIRSCVQSTVGVGGYPSDGTASGFSGTNDVQVYICHSCGYVKLLLPMTRCLFMITKFLIHSESYSTVH